MDKGTLVNLWFAYLQWSLSGGEERGAGLVEVCGGFGGVALPRWSAASHTLAPSAVERHGPRRVQPEPGVGLRQAGPAMGWSSALPGERRGPGASGGRRDIRDARPGPGALLQCHAWGTNSPIPASNASPRHQQTHRSVSLRAERGLDGAAVSQHGSDWQ